MSYLLNIQPKINAKFVYVANNGIILHALQVAKIVKAVEILIYSRHM